MCAVPMRYFRSFFLFSSITKFTARIFRWEGKAEHAGSDHCAIQLNVHVEALKEYNSLLSVNSVFKRNHFAVVKLEKAEELEAEQVILDHHMDKIMEFSDPLLQLLAEPEKASRSYKLL